MSKAFVKESSESADANLESDRSYSSPGERNYITPAGALRLQKELQNLKHRERPEVVRIVEWAAGNGDRSENGDYLYGKKRLREIDRRMRFLIKRLEIAEVVDPLQVRSDQVLFGATVTIRDEEDNERTYTIVGVDEVDVPRGLISWRSPLANALLKARVGDVVQFHAPRGTQEIEVMKIEYRAVEPQSSSVEKS